MGLLKNKIDFAIVIVAEDCSPNFDPVFRRPRQDLNGYGEISDVCLKRKIRNRLQVQGEKILIQSRELVDDGYNSIKARLDGCKRFKEEVNKKTLDLKACEQIACKEWFDVRAFGQTLPFKWNVSGFGIKGPVTIRTAKTIEPVLIREIEFVKSTNLNDTENNQKDSSTLVCKYIIDKGVYVSYGSILPTQSERTGFSEEDVEVLKQAILTMLEGDESTFRPSGCMSIDKVFWWTHSEECGKLGACSSAKVHRSLHFTSQDEYPYYSVEAEDLKSVNLEILDFGYGIQ